ncbi:hypothetical protein AK812_SmicGene46129 [Symbiodinium microadriaticum]|uniref:Uncharacterized protein n=1 Tax=Symbiodinium microadriaticum TaxID=2951 RepID=A0A1Q9BUN5_SYMMI|nr:hypothetical protein AK812_SmicGene46129 [Symbiodinium microadriaticum]
MTMPIRVTTAASAINTATIVTIMTVTVSGIRTVSFMASVIIVIIVIIATPTILFVASSSPSSPSAAGAPFTKTVTKTSPDLQNLVEGLLQSSAAQANDVCMNTVMKSAVRGHQWQLPAHVIAGMPGRALTPNEISGSTLLSACEKSRSWRHALQQLRWGQGARSSSSIGWNAAASACVDVWPQGLALLVPWLHTLI